MTRVSPEDDELLEIEAIPHRRAGNQRRIHVLDLQEFVQRGAQRAAALGEIADVFEKFARGWAADAYRWLARPQAVPSLEAGGR